MRTTLHGEVEMLYHRIVKAIGVPRHGRQRDPKWRARIHSDNTRSTYLKVWHRVVRFAATGYGIESLSELQPYMVERWLLSLANRRLAKQTLRTYIAAVHKLEAAITDLRKGGWFI